MPRGEHAFLIKKKGKEIISDMGRVGSRPHAEVWVPKQVIIMNKLVLGSKILPKN